MFFFSLIFVFILARISSLFTAYILAIALAKATAATAVEHVLVQTTTVENDDSELSYSLSFLFSAFMDTWRVLGSFHNLIFKLQKRSGKKKQQQQQQPGLESNELNVGH